MNRFRIGKRKIMALAAAAALGVVAYLAWLWWDLTGLVLVTLATVVAGAGAIAYLVVSAERRIRGEMAFFAYTNKDVILDVEKRLTRPGEQDEALLRALNAQYRRLEEELVRRLREPGD
ncbi:MAG: hypothetical protein DIU67_008045 [Actinomycetes bacterium]|jgi:hypothetical protein|nr:MAG: hypothetical protein DIU67_09655 [Actinomycetota bacterium]